MNNDYMRVSEIEKRKHKTAIYREAVDWCQSNYYIVNGIVWIEETYWKNCLLVGTGIARNTFQTIEQFFGDSIYNYIIK